MSHGRVRAVVARTLPGIGLALLVLPGVVAAQSGGGGQVGPGARIGVRFVASPVINVLLGGALLAFAPRYARERVADVDDAGEVFV